MADKKNKNFQGNGADLFLSNASAPVLTINPFFEALIPALSPEEKEMLEENLLSNGIREAISVWGDTIIDGHNRYEIARKHNLPYVTAPYDFERESDAIIWIIQNQFGRRNLSAYDRSVLALRLKPALAEQAKERQLRKPARPNAPITESHDFSDARDTPNFVCQISDKQNPMDTKKALAEIAGVSHDTLFKVEKLEQAAPPELKARLQRGDISINKAYQHIQRQENRVNAPAPEVTPRGPSFNVIYADPWQKDGIPLPLKTLKALDVPADDQAVLFLWADAPKLRDAMAVMEAWGFSYKTCAAWDKGEPDAVHWFRGQHDLLLVGTKGTFPAPKGSALVSSVYRETLAQDKKPDYFYALIERMHPDGRYVEVFARKKHNDRWAVWGEPDE